MIQQTISVLPLADTSVSKDQDYFSEGLVEELVRPNSGKENPPCPFPNPSLKCAIQATLQTFS
jgi:hypothetical protein